MILYKRKLLAPVKSSQAGVSLPKSTLSLSHPRIFFAGLLMLTTAFCGLRNGMSGYSTTRGVRPSGVGVGHAIDGLDLDGIRRCLQEGIITSEELVEV